MFGIFKKCTHPWGMLVIRSDEKVIDVGEDFTVKEISFFCMECNSVLTKRYATFTKGVSGFLRRG